LISSRILESSSRALSSFRASSSRSAIKEDGIAMSREQALQTRTPSSVSNAQNGHFNVVSLEA
jgi:hypothetical protein